MIIILPKDVVLYCLSFIYFTQDYSNILCLSKNINKKIKKSLDMQKYNKFMNHVLMLANDKYLIYNFQNNYNIVWERYHKYRWINKRYNCGFYKIGDIVDAKDYVNAWCPAKIIKKKLHSTRYFDMEKNCMQFKFMFLYSVKFEGWSNNFNEDIEIDKIKPLGSKTVNPNNKLKCFVQEKFEPLWCLIKNVYNNTWNVRRIIRVLNNNKNDMLLVSNSGMQYKVIKKNIDYHICSFSNATVFLSDSEHTFKYDVKHFIY